MKRIMILAALVLLITAAQVNAMTYGAEYYRQHKQSLMAGTYQNDPLWLFMDETQDLIGSTGTTDTGGTVYFVDNNAGNDNNDGKSWGKPFLLISTALAASHANIAVSPNYANRNRIYVKGDDFDEDWTKMAQKTDIIGVGSDDGNKMPRILGNHVVEAASSGNYMGCRFINMTFLNQAAGPIFTIPTGQHGIEFVGCKFENSGTTGSSTGILWTACSDIKILWCDFINGGTGFTTGAISIGAGASNLCHIAGNWIDSEIGITANGSTTGVGNIIESNRIYATTLTIDDNADIFFIANNTLISAAVGTAAYDFTDALSINNKISYSTGDADAPLIPGKIYALTKTATAADDDLFIVSGGPIEIISFQGHVTTQIGSGTNTLAVILDADAPWIDMSFTTAVDIDADVVGTRYLFSNAAQSVLTPISNTAGGTNLMESWFCGQGVIEQDSQGTPDGAIVWYMTFRPLAPNVSVIVAP